MNEQTIKDILRRLKALEQSTPRLRVGTVTDTNPLDVALGGSTTSYTDVKALGGPALTTGDVVAVLVAGNDLLVLGAIGGLRTVRGIVTSAAVVFEGDEFTAAKNSTGDYTVTFDTPFADIPVVNVTPVSVNPFHTTTGTPTADDVNVLTFNSANAAGDVAFSFEAIGPA